jgi:hypothetical protein
MTNRSGKLIVAVLLVLPALLPVFLVWKDAVNVVFWDQWLLVPMFDRYYRGTLTVADLFAQHNEHRMVFPRLAFLALDTLTRYNTIVESYASCVVISVGAVILLIASRRAIVAKDRVVLRLLPVTWIFFSLRPFEAYLFGIDLQWMLGTTFLLLALALVDRVADSPRALWVAAGAAIVTSFSYASGLLAWPVGALQLLWLWQRGRIGRERALSLLAQWFACAAVVIVSYFTGYLPPGDGSNLQFAFSHPLTVLLYYLATIGSSLGVTLWEAIAYGVVLVALGLGALAMYARRDKWFISSFPLGLIVYALGSGLLLAVGRSVFGVAEALATRYALLTIPLVIGLYLVLVSARGIVESRRLALLVFLVAVFFGVLTSDWKSLVVGDAWRVEKNQIVHDILTYRFQSDATLAASFDDPEKVRSGAQILERYRLNVFAEPPRPAP